MRRHPLTDYSARYPVLVAHFPPHMLSSPCLFSSFAPSQAVSWVLAPHTAILWGWWSKSKPPVFVVWDHLCVSELISLRKDAEFWVPKPNKNVAGDAGTQCPHSCWPKPVTWKQKEGGIALHFLPKDLSDVSNLAKMKCKTWLMTGRFLVACLWEGMGYWQCGSVPTQPKWH